MNPRTLITKLKKKILKKKSPSRQELNSVEWNNVWEEATVPPRHDAVESWAFAMLRDVGGVNPSLMGNERPRTATQVAAFESQQAWYNSVRNLGMSQAELYVPPPATRIAMEGYGVRFHETLTPQPNDMTLQGRNAVKPKREDK